MSVIVKMLLEIEPSVALTGFEIVKSSLSSNSSKASLKAAIINDVELDSAGIVKLRSAGNV